jgi:multiple antibiotic resistance protein
VLDQLRRAAVGETPNKSALHSVCIGSLLALRQTVGATRFSQIPEHDPWRLYTGASAARNADIDTAFFACLLLGVCWLVPDRKPGRERSDFLALTRYCSDSERHALALRVAVNGFFLLLGSLLVGSYVLEFFGITLPVLRIAGGFVVTMFGWTLLRAGEELGDQRAAEASRGPDTPPDAFYPLTMPLTVGPGAISVAIALGSQRPKEATDFAHLAMLAGVAIAGLGAVAVTIYICYRFAEPTIAALGKHGTNVVVRLSAFLLLCIGIQIVWTGFSELQTPSVAPH